VAAKVSERIDPASDQGHRIVSALIDSESQNLIRQLHAIPPISPHIGDKLRKARKARKSEVLDALCKELLPDACDCISDENPAPGPRILAADDSMAIRKFYESVLSTAGYQVFTAEDGQIAYTKLQFDRFDLLITDLNMPNMDGIELAQKVRGESDTEKMPIIMVTTESEQSQRNLAEQQKINGFVNKPIKPDVLLQAIRALGL
jgi:CheY-like chemotaxis protein